MTNKYLPLLYRKTCDERNEQLRRSGCVAIEVDGSDDGCCEHITHVMAVTCDCNAYLLHQLQHKCEPKTAEVMLKAAQQGLDILKGLCVLCVLCVVDNESKMKKFRRMLQHTETLDSI